MVRHGDIIRSFLLVIVLSNNQLLRKIFQLFIVVLISVGLFNAYMIRLPSSEISAVYDIHESNTLIQN